MVAQLISEQNMQSPFRGSRSVDKDDGVSATVGVSGTVTVLEDLIRMFGAEDDTRAMVQALTRLKALQRTHVKINQEHLDQLQKLKDELSEAKNRFHQTENAAREVSQ